MEGLAEGIEKFREIATAMVAVEPVDTGDPRELTFQRADGELYSVPVPPPLRSHTVLGIDDFIAAVLRATENEWHLGAASREKMVNQPVIWQSPEALVLVLDDTDRRDRVSMKLEMSPQWLTLEQYNTDINEPVRLSKRQLVQLLKMTLRDCVVNGRELLSSVEQIKFAASEAGGSVIQRGNESWDSDVTKKAMGMEDVSELWQVDFPVFANVGERKNRETILCYFDVDVRDQKFIFRPMPGEMDVALEVAQDKIRQRIAKGASGVPLFYGRP